MIRSLLLLFLCAVLPAQIVRLANHSPGPFDGWVPTTTDYAIEDGAAGEWPGGARFVAGRVVGKDLRMVHVRVQLKAGEARKLDLREAKAIDFTAKPPASAEWTGGVLSVESVPMQWVSLEADGPSWLAHLRLRMARMMHVDVWVRHYPGESYARGEVVYCCSNPTVPEVFEEAPALRIGFGDAVIAAPGRTLWQPLIDQDRFADGMARAVPFVALWPRHAHGAKPWASAYAVSSMSIGAVGITKLLPDGNPLYPPNHDGLAWARGLLSRSIESLHGPQPPPAGISADSTQTGEQWDQLFVGGEALLPGGVGAEAVTYLNALAWAKRPCHHLEANGDPLRVAEHPDLVFWEGRPHEPRVSRDQLGKNRRLAKWDFPGGWYGPDRQHWLMGQLCAAARYKGSPAIQWILEHQANCFLLGETVDPKLSTSGVDSARSVGYAGIVAVQLDCNLEKRAKAAAVVERWRDRATMVYIPQLGASPGDVWDPKDDQRIIGDFEHGKYTHGVMWWQQALGSYGLDLACAELGPVEGRAIALRGALAVLRHAYTKQVDRWVEWDNTAWTGHKLPASEMVEGKAAHRTGWFSTSWFSCAAATVLRHDPTNGQARDIWTQMLSDTLHARRSWLPPRSRGAAVLIR